MNRVVEEVVLRAGDHGLSPVMLEVDWETKRLEEERTDDFPAYRMRLRGPSTKKKLISRARLSYMLRRRGMVKRASALLERYGISLVNIHYPSLVFDPLIQAVDARRGCRTVLSFHGGDLANTDDEAYWSAMGKHVLSHADAVVVPSSALAEKVRWVAHGVDVEVSVVYSGVDEGWAKCAGGARESPLGLDTVVHVGAFTDVKGHRALIDAWRIVLERRPAARLKLVGRTGAALSMVRARVEELGLGASVTVQTDVPHDDVAPIMREADLFVLPSLDEGGVPLVLLEAASLHIPVVASRVGGIPELLRHEENGLLVPPSDPTALADAIVRLLEQPDEAWRYATALREDVMGRFTWESTVRGYRDVFDTVLDRERR